MSSIDEKVINELIILYENRSFEKLLNKAKILLKDYPNNYFINNICGMTHINLSNFQKSSDFFSKAIKINPNNFEAYNNLGTSLNYLGKFKESIASYKSALKFNIDRKQMQLFYTEKIEALIIKQRNKIKI